MEGVNMHNLMRVLTIAVLAITALLPAPLMEQEIQKASFWETEVWNKNLIRLHQTTKLTPAIREAKLRSIPINPALFCLRFVFFPFHQAIAAYLWLLAFP